MKLSFKEISKAIRERAGVLIEQWSNGKFYVIKHRWSDDYKHNREIHPNEIFKLMATLPDVIVVNQKSLGRNDPFRLEPKGNLCCEIPQNDFFVSEKALKEFRS